MLRVKISFTYRGVPLSLEVEASDKTDIEYLLDNDLGDVLASMQKFVDAELKKVDKNEGEK